MKTNIDLIGAWNRYISKGLMKNIFKSQIGEIEAGVRPSQNGPEQYVLDFATGKNICEPPQFKQFDNGMQILFEPFGGLKPYTSPMSVGKQKDLPVSAEECLLACQNPINPLSILKRTPLLQIKLPKSEWLAFPNVTPWERRGLVLWVPSKSDGVNNIFPHQLQILTRAVVEDFLNISALNKQFVTFFNSTHGGASANHLHFQSSYSDHKMAVELSERIQKGNYTVTNGYCAVALVFPKNVSVDVLWEAIEKIQKVGRPLNLIYLSSGIYLFIRDQNNEIVEEFPGRGLGAINLAGMIVTGDKSYFTRVNEKTIASAFTKTTISSNMIDFLLEK